MKPLVIESTTPISHLEGLLARKRTLVIIRQPEDDGVLLHILTAAFLRKLARDSGATGTVMDLLPAVEWLSVYPRLAPSEGLKPGEKLAGAYCEPGLADMFPPPLVGSACPAPEPPAPAFRAEPAADERPSPWTWGDHEAAMSAPGGVEAIPRMRVPRMGEPRHAAPPPPAIEPFEAYPGILAPETAVVGKPIHVDVWLSETPVAGVEGPAGETEVHVDLPAGAVYFDLDLQVVAHGFRAEAPGWRQTIRVYRDHPADAKARFTLIADPQAEPVRTTPIQVHFTYQGNSCGYFWREVQVLATEFASIPDVVAALGREVAAAIMTESRPAPVQEEPAAIMRIPVGEPAADLTVRISKVDLTHDTLVAWTFESPLALDMPEPCEVDLGDQPEAYARALMDQIQQCPRGKSIIHLIKGIGKELSDKIPAAFWRLVDEVRTQVEPRTPSVLILTEEAAIPWELAWVDAAWAPDRPAYLGAQFSLSRWILSSSRSGPAQPPPSQVEVTQVTVLAGDYASTSGLRPLPHAMEEAGFLERELRAAQFKATQADLEVVLGGEYKTNLLHFACHGEADPSKPELNRILLAENVYLDPSSVRGYELSKTRPFVFLNACQVGQAGESLGDYAGFPGAFLKEGCPGFLGPLWKVDDVVACDVAEQFYTEALKSQAEEQRTVGEIMRDLRSRFPGPDATDSRPAATYLAYVYYGHPNLRLIDKKGE